jgi:hypothetical protein
LGNRKEKRTKVNKTSVKAPLEASVPPSRYAEAVFEQCPDIEDKLDSLCQDLASCHIEKDGPGIFAIIQGRLQEAIDSQESMKAKALYREIVFKKDGPVSKKKK